MKVKMWEADSGTLERVFEKYTHVRVYISVTPMAGRKTKTHGSGVATHGRESCSSVQMKLPGLNYVEISSSRKLSSSAHGLATRLTALAMLSP